ncbi:MAG: peptidoglycan editing factor PgeF [Spirochaetia bacterium]|nr:peptidoglycan editing factor PgeF [Spirochaetia bacterium]
MKTPKGFTLHKKGKIQYFTCDAISKIHGTVHAFICRTGGVSKKPYDSLNIGAQTDDKQELIERNMELAERALGIDYATAVRQIHGNVVEVITDKTSPAPYEADGLITAVYGSSVAVRVADCIGTVLVDPVNMVVASVHSGWRGVANRILVRAVRKMKKEFGSKSSDIIAAMSMAIGPCCFEVGAEVIKLKKQAVFSNIFTKRGKSVYMDMWKGNTNLLLKEGLKSKNIHTLKLCTSCNPELFFSHRRDKGKTGRMMIVAGLK